MACRLDRAGVATIVLTALKESQSREDITESTKLWADLHVGRTARRRFFRPVRRRIEEEGCVFSAIQEESFDDFKSVREIIEAVWKNIQKT